MPMSNVVMHVDVWAVKIDPWSVVVVVVMMAQCPVLKVNRE